MQVLQNRVIVTDIVMNTTTATRHIAHKTGTTTHEITTRIKTKGYLIDLGGLGCGVSACEMLTPPTT